MACGFKGTFKLALAQCGLVPSETVPKIDEQTWWRYAPHGTLRVPKGTGASSRPKLGYAERLEGGPRAVYQRHFDEPERDTQPKPLSTGWALKMIRKQSRFSEKQKSYLVQKFNVGEQTGRKIDAIDVKMDMHRAKDDNGMKLFKPTEFLTEQQISGFFSREAAKRRKKTRAGVDHDSFPAAVEEAFLENLQDTVHKAVDIQHPIVFHTLNISKLVKTKSLIKQTVSKLKDICIYLNMETSDISTKSRKRPYIKKIESFVDDCSC